jgi:hypothetical protein
MSRQLGCHRSLLDRQDRKRADAVAGLSVAMTDISWSADERSVAAAAEDGSVVVFRYPEKLS